MRMKSLLLMGTVLALPVAANAQAITGPYVSGSAGANFMQNESVSSLKVGNSTFNLGKTKLDFNTGEHGTVAFGYGLGNGLRIEIEGDYFNNGVSKIGRATNGGLGSGFTSYNQTANGTEVKYGGFLNALYDIDPVALGFSATPWPVTPYVGLGAGYLQDVDHIGIYQAGPGGFLLRDHGTDGSFAYQAIIGAAFAIPGVPGLAATIDYRFTSQLDNRSFRTQFFAPGVATGASLHEAQDYNHSINLGLRYALYQPAPPPPAAPVPVAAPAPAPSRSYLVFFDWDRADLTARARQIIAEAAQASTHVQYTRIEVNGYTDTSGTAQYNQRLSVRRAQTVEGELIRDGVPQSAITIQGFGETHPLVPTAQGVREPQNRRVEIIIR